MKKIAVIILCLGQVFLAKSENYYVCKKGSDANNGSFKNPFFTL